MAEPLARAKVSGEFGSAWPHGCCTVLDSTERLVCGFPLHADGTCPLGHPAAEPGQ